VLFAPWWKPAGEKGKNACRNQDWPTAKLGRRVRGDYFSGNERGGFARRLVSGVEGLTLN